MDLEKIFTFNRDFVTHVNHYQIINVGGFPENETIGLCYTAVIQKHQ